MSLNHLAANLHVAMLVSSCGGRAGWMPLWHCWMHFILYFFLEIEKPYNLESVFADVTWCDCMLNMFEYLTIPKPVLAKHVHVPIQW